MGRSSLVTWWRAGSNRRFPALTGDSLVVAPCVDTRAAAAAWSTSPESPRMPVAHPQARPKSRASVGASQSHALPAEAWFPPWLGPPLIAAAFVGLTRWSWRKWPDVHIDFGSQLYIPWILTQGRALYLDLEYKDGPLSQYLNALWFTLFGVSLRTLIWCNLALLAGLCALVYVIFARACGRCTATLVVLVQLGVFSFSQYTGIGNYNYVTPYAQEQTHGLILSVAMIFALGRCAEGGRAWWSALAGAALGLTFLTKAELFVPALASFTMGAEYDPADATGFIRLFGLPMKVNGIVQRQAGKGGPAKAARRKK